MQDIKRVEFRERKPNTNTKICFDIQTPSSTSPPSPRRISTLSTKNSKKNTNSILYTRGGTKSIISTQEMGTKPKHKVKKMVYNT